MPLALFTNLPTTVILGNPVSDKLASRKLALSCVALCVLCGVWLHRTETGWASANNNSRKFTVRYVAILCILTQLGEYKGQISTPVAECMGA